MRKRLLSILLVACLMVGMVPLSAMAAEEVVSGTCGENLTWVLDSDGVLTISGTGAMSDFPSFAPWDSSRNSITSVHIGDGITNIGDYAFQACGGLTGVTIPNGITSIGESAFAHCESLVTIEIPDTVTSIDRYAFNHCSSLTHLILSDGVTSIGDHAFVNCGSLTGITIPASVASIGDRVFEYCDKLANIDVTSGNLNFQSREGILYDKALTELIRCPGAKTGSVRIPDGVTSIHDYAFSNCSSLTSVTIPGSVTSINDHAFSKCSSLTSVTISNGVTSIGERAFWLCSSLVNVTIPDSVTSIDMYAFYACDSLTSVTIPGSVTVIKADAFGSCDKLANIDVVSENLNYRSHDGVLYNKAQTELICCPSGKTGSYTIPDSVTRISGSAFANCSSLTSVTIPSSVASIGSDAFYNCSSLTTMTIPNSVTAIDSSTFSDCSSLTDVTIGNKVTSIGQHAFRGCNSLTNLTLPDSISSIADYALVDCINLTNIQVSSGNAYFQSQDGVLFNKALTKLICCPAGKSGRYVVPDSITSIGIGAFRGCEGLTGVTIPASVTSMGIYAFSLCSGLTSAGPVSGEYCIEFGWETAIPENAFYGCDSLTSAMIPKGITSIGKNAFAYCEGLVTVEIPDTVTSIGNGALQGCRSVTSMTIPATVTGIEENVFWNCYSMTDITFLGCLTDIKAQAFAMCSGLTDVYYHDTEESWRQINIGFVNSDLTEANIHYDAHNLETRNAKVATCTEDGYTGDKVCTECKKSITSGEIVPATGHITNSANAKPATCTENGYTGDGVCSVCGETVTEGEAIPALGHQYKDKVTAPTCTEQGYTTHTCSVCGDKVIDTATPALGHDYQKNEEKSVAAVPGKDGYDYFECSRNPAHFYTVPVFAPIVTHTATFVVGEEVIGVVTFEEGSTSLKEPNLPERKNYVGQWESYDLANAKTDIIIHGQYTPVDPDKVSDVESGAEAEYADGVATITLTAAAASKTIKVVSETTTPVDVVLVLDQSGSMAENLSRYDRQSKRDALVGCAKEFAQSLFENAEKTGADHRVAVTGFAYSAYNRGKYENTGLLATPNGSAIKYDNIKDSDYQRALLLINNGGEINQNVLSGIDSIVADGATAADLGLRMASNIFAENPTQGKRQRIVIFITDGTPTSWNEEASLIRPTAADAISIANNIKNGQDGKIYCVGVHANADSAAAFTSDKDGVKTDRWGNFISYDFNRFLHAVSSNYSDSKSMDSLGEGDKNGGYYMAVNDTGNLGNIFTNILYSTVYELKTFDQAAFHYTLPAEFTLTIEQEMALREELKKAHGITDEDIVIDRKPDGTTELQFSNIPTKEVYDETGALVYQATVAFEATANQKANGSTGTGTGDIQYGDSALTEFTAPTVEVPADRHLLVFTINRQVYQITEAELGDSITVPDSRLASWAVDPGTVVDGDYTVFEATTVSDTKYNLTWSMNGTEMVQQYQFGEAIIPPDPNTYAPEGCEFSRWSRSIPATMPAYNLECTAIYSPAHVHEFVKAYQTGDCDTGITTIYRCACGEEKSEQAAPEQHNYTAVFSDNGFSGNTMEKLVCTKCGHSEEKNITFKVAYSESRKTTVLDLSLYENQVSVSEPDKEIELRFYIGGEDGKRYTITRIDPDGRRTKYQGVSENGYLVFKADHFSIYVIGELDETGQETEELDYEQATEILDRKVDATEPEKPNPPTPTTPSGGSSEPDEPEEPDEVWENPYTDISSAKWYYESVRYVTENGLMTGFGGGKFGPGEALTRAQMAQVLYNREGKPAVTAENAFTDVVNGAWYSSAVIWAADHDIVSGYGNNKFGPDDPITREQLVTILWRYAGKPETTGSLDSFIDSGKASDWATSALQWAVEKEIVTGKGNGILDPKGRATRAEVATMLMRYCELGE